MPETFKGQPTPEQLQDPRGDILHSEEKRLLDLATAKGISKENIGAFFIIIVADLPYAHNEEEYQIFSEEELIDQAAIEPSWFYDYERRRLIGTIPPTAKIREAIAADVAIKTD